MKGETIVINTKIAEAIEVLAEALRTEEWYWDSWKANLAMAYHDEYYTQINKRTEKGADEGEIVHQIFNDAAERFLKQLTYRVVDIGDGDQGIIDKNGNGVNWTE